MKSFVLVVILLPLIISFVTLLLSRGSPITEHQTNKSKEKLRSVYLKWHFGAICFYLLMIVFLLYIFIPIFKYLGELRVGVFAPAVFEYRACVIMWFLPCIFLAAITALIPSILIMRILLRKRYYEYCYYRIQIRKFNTKRFIPYVVWGTAIVTSCLFLACFQHYARFSENEILINRARQIIVDRYDYDDIQELNYVHRVLIRSGATHKRIDPHYRILFKDKTQWLTRESVFCIANAEYALLFDYLEEKTGLTIVKKDHLP